MKLSELAVALGLEAYGSGDPEIEGISEDSREIGPGQIFVALPGKFSQGRDFIPQAMERGAAALMLPWPDGPYALPRILVKERHLRGLASRAAALIYGRPHLGMPLIGLTGTNGKSTSLYLMEAILKEEGRRPGIVGTVEYRWPGHSRPAPNTTPEGPLLLRTLRDMEEGGADICVMEVSSHALALGRVEGLSFRAALFTNLSQDHLDFHDNMEDYFAAKSYLFTQKLEMGGLMPGPFLQPYGPYGLSDQEAYRRAYLGAINTDDPYGARLLSELSDFPLWPIDWNPSFLGFGFNSGDFRGFGLSCRREGISFKVMWPESYPSQDSPDSLKGRGSSGHSQRPGQETGPEMSWEEITIESPLLGAFNAYNLLGAAALSCVLGLRPQSVVAALSRCPGAPGRLEKVGSHPGFLALVDYAHSPGALAAVLGSLKELIPDSREASGPRLISVFGCGGDRDAGKRPLMGEAAGKHSHIPILTSDNPRTEDPLAIMAQAEKGLRDLGLGRASEEEALKASGSRNLYLAEADRRLAIKMAARIMAPGDILLVAGKGHEDYQIVGREKRPFDDRAETLKALSELGKASV
jgi:UDP-N-acetylmuramoyl-L-alanyl-D-glutamate--2,6-diaminopimelate ligase